MKDYSELKRMAEDMKGWDKITECWPSDENGPDWQVGRLDEEDNRWPLMTVDTEQYDQEQDAPKVAQYYAAANTVAVLALIAEVEGLRKGRTDWQAECLKRGFEYVRESDDHYVLADIPEMAELLGMLLGVEVRSKDNDSYGETVSILQDMADANSDAFHRAYELEKENESLKKDAARYRWLRKQNWFDSDIAVVRSPNESIKLGYDCPSTERLDDYIDNEIKESKS